MRSAAMAYRGHARPMHEAIAGMSATPFFEDRFANFSNWYVYDQADTPTIPMNKNGERSQPKRANATIVSEAGTLGGTFARLLVKRETYMGLPLTGVQMEHYGHFIGNGKAFCLETRVRWTGYLGGWYGPWTYAIDGPHIGAEIDLMETINTRGPLSTIHVPEIAGQFYSATNDGGWHTYALRVDSTGLKWFMDGRKTMAVADAGKGSQLVASNMFLKMQHLCGGSFPNFDNGSTIPDSSLPTSDKAFDCDYYRIWRAP